MLQQKVPYKAGHVWTDPHRDFGIVFPLLIRKTVACLEHEYQQIKDLQVREARLQELSDEVEVLGKFITQAHSTAKKDIHILIREVLDLVSLNFNFSVMLLRVLCSYFHKCQREQVHPDESPANVDWFEKADEN